jgi:hypothetical protein
VTRGSSRSLTHAAAGDYPRQQPSDKPLIAASAAHTPSSRRLHCRFAFMDSDRCLQALCSKDRVWLPRPVQKHAQDDRYQNVRCWTWSLELCTVLLGYYPINISRCSKRARNRDLELEDVYSCATAKTFLYSAGLTAEVEPLPTPHFPSPSTLELCGGLLGASDPSSHQRCTMQCAGMLWGISVPAAHRHYEARSILINHTSASLTRLLA